MLITSDYKEENERPVRGGNHHGSIKTHGKFSRILHKQYTGASKIREENTIYKGAYAIRIVEIRGRLQGREQKIRGTEKMKSNIHGPTSMEATIRATSNSKSIKCLHNAGTIRGD